MKASLLTTTVIGVLALTGVDPTNAQPPVIAQQQQQAAAAAAAATVEAAQAGKGVESRNPAAAGCRALRQDIAAMMHQMNALAAESQYDNFTNRGSLPQLVMRIAVLDRDCGESAIAPQVVSDFDTLARLEKDDRRIPALLDAIEALERKLADAE